MQMPSREGDEILSEYREQLRQKMNEATAKETEDRDTYADGYAGGLIGHATATSRGRRQPRSLRRHGREVRPR